MEKFPDTKFESVGYKKEFGFQLVEMKDLFSFKPDTKKNPFQPHRINFFAILLLTEGEMTHEVDFVEYKMTEGDCLFISKDQIHKFDKSGNYNGYGVIFTEEFMLHHLSLSAFSKISFFHNNHLNPSLFKDPGNRDLFLVALKRELSLDLGKAKADVVASMLTVFLLKTQLNTNRALQFYPNDYLQFMEFRKLVSSKYTETRTAKDYTSFLNITHKQLNKLCKEFTKKTTKEYINNYIVLEAKRKLAATNLPIKHIAYECGFSEMTNFLKFFKQITGITPKQFREIRT
ncbi:MAG: helix-turn-helix transcriptional regulator [Bacteroidota bacterium]